MPCYDARCEIDSKEEVEAMLCAVFKMLGEEKALELLCNKEALAIHGIAYAYVESWWRGHTIRGAIKASDIEG